ncbi:hypothetical protein GvMRE_I1g680 [endosymbiont GvMRE of Glomus versiforme]|nr:hypothetical protein GvMRE_I1g680 [endosymbiont GvMRE of Glomus versiforme]
MLILTLTILNTLGLFCLTYWLFNKDCWKCKKEKPLKRIFKNLCPSCERREN